jgi:hypothetical protein
MQTVVVDSVVKPVPADGQLGEESSQKSCRFRRSGQLTAGAAG